MKTILTKEKIKVDGVIVKAGSVVSVPESRADRLIGAGHAEPSRESPIDTMRMTWVTPKLDIRVAKKGGVGKDRKETIRAGVAVELPGQRADKLIKNGKAKACDAPVFIPVKPKPKEIKGDTNEGKKNG